MFRHVIFSSFPFTFIFPSMCFGVQYFLPSSFFFIFLFFIFYLFIYLFFIYYFFLLLPFMCSGLQYFLPSFLFHFLPFMCSGLQYFLPSFFFFLIFTPSFHVFRGAIFSSFLPCVLQFSSFLFPLIFLPRHVFGRAMRGL